MKSYFIFIVLAAAGIIYYFINKNKTATTAAINAAVGASPNADAIALQLGYPSDLKNTGDVTGRGMSGSPRYNLPPAKRIPTRGRSGLMP